MPDGPSKGIIGVKYTYSTSAIDPDGHRIRFCFNWGDGSVSWTDFVESDETASATHVFDKGCYKIQVKAQDELGFKSERSNPLEVTIPRNKATVNSWFHWFLERFPILEKILYYIFENRL